MPEKITHEENVAVLRAIDTNRDDPLSAHLKKSETAINAHIATETGNNPNTFTPEYTIDAQELKEYTDTHRETLFHVLFEPNNPDL